jgi:putative ABC transport system permease protein
MQQILNITLGFIEQGLIYGVLVLGLYISYKILNFPDLTVDGSFPLGAAITAVMITSGLNPWLALLAAFGCGVLAGLCTGLIHVKLKISDLLSGILVMTGLYSVNLLIVGKPNLPFFDQKTIFNSGPAALLPEKAGTFNIRVLVISLLIVLVLKYALDLYLKTRSGTLLRATGDNSQVVIAVARDPGLVKILGLSLANGLVALSGSILCQQQNFFEVSMGTGSMVAGLASVILGATLLRRLRFLRQTSMVIWGSIFYKALISMAIAAGLDSKLLRLMQSVLFLIILVTNRLIGKGGKKANA